MRGKLARGIRRAVWDALERSGRLETSGYRITNGGRQVECTGYRKAIKVTKKKVKEAKRCGS